MNELEHRKKIIDKWLENPQRPYHLMAKELKTTPTTVKSVLDRYFETLSISRKRKSGGKQGAHNKKLDQVVITTIMENRSMSVRDVAKKCQTSKSMVQRVKQRTCLRTRKKQKIPKVTEKQRKVIKTRARKLYDSMGKKNACLVMDDETYVKADFSTLPGPQYYTLFEGELLPDSVTSIGIEKFGAKYLVWQAICQCGSRSTAFVTTGTINAEVYVNECLKKRLLPFLRKHDGPTWFWPDLASAHYAHVTLNMLKQNGVDFVPKYMNPPNVPQCRPIERYWALVKNKLRAKEQPAKNMIDFTYKWKKAARAIKRSTVTNLMKSIRKKLRKEWSKV